MGVCDFVCHIQKNGQNGYSAENHVEEYEQYGDPNLTDEEPELLQDPEIQELTRKEKKDFYLDQYQEIYGNDCFGFDKGILVFVPKTNTRKQIFTKPYPWFAKFKKQLWKYSHDGWEFYKIINGKKIYLKWEHDQESVWEHKRYPKHWLVSFEPNFYKWFVKCDIPVEKIPILSLLQPFWNNSRMFFDEKKYKRMMRKALKSDWSFDKKLLYNFIMNKFVTIQDE